MLSILTIPFTILLVLALFLNVLSLPGNWLALIFIALWKWLFGADIPLTWTFFLILAAIVLVAEVLEFVIQAYGSKKYGGTKKGNWGGIIGSIIGSIVGAPFFFGLGAIPGALIGAYAGCYLLETGQGRTGDAASRAAWGAMWGKFFGMGLKFALGIAMVAVAVPRLWPE